MFELLSGTRINRSGFLLVLVVTVCMAGCGEGSKARFQPHKRVKQLMPAAREAVTQTIEKHFGQPDALVAWSKLPVDYGLVETTVTAVQKAGENKGQRILELAPPPAPAFAGQSLQFTRENEEGDELVEFLRIESVSADTKSLVVAGKIFPEADTEVSIGGHKLKHGKELYMKHCLHCHGVSGDGNGPTGKYLNPRPRDFRPGLFKFKSTDYSERPSRADLAHTIQEGIPGTYMPSFRLLPKEEVTAIVEYVRWLTMRGETEKKLVDEFEAEYSLAEFKNRTSEEGGETVQEVDTELAELLTDDYIGIVEEATDSVADKWELADDKSSVVIPEVPRVKDSLASRERGRAFYTRVKCITCHGPLGLGDGSETETYKKNPLTNEEYAEPGLYDSWGIKVKPRNLRSGQFRGGRRPIDVFRRVAAGIPGTPMQGFRSSLSDEQIWDVVNYVLHLPHEDLNAARQPAVSKN